MPKRFWLCGFLCAEMQRSTHRSVLSVASLIRSMSVIVEETTSSKAMMMSPPMEFCDSMDFSGVSSIRLPSFFGSSNSTPCSVISASFRSETIWKPPLSVKMLPDHCMKLCRPPHLSSKSQVGRFARWKVLPNRILQPSARMSSEDIPLIVPWVPTGMKTGVNTSPCGNITVEARARPHVASSLNTSGGSESAIARSSADAAV
mmetsp:Transcript_728/g.1760  ORF Transcript_728/g.1760 Transcript_728/m.1760 type:complete len:203 (-) Transcript_728:148-756(-)